MLVSNGLQPREQSANAGYELPQEKKNVRKTAGNNKCPQVLYPGGERFQIPASMLALNQFVDGPS